MLPDLLGVLVAALVLASPFIFRRLRHSRVTRADGGPSARPATSGAGRAAVPAVTVQPSSEEREPFHYGGILAVEPHDEEDQAPL